jgi:hypothetical protein
MTSQTIQAVEKLCSALHEQKILFHLVLLEGSGRRIPDYAITIEHNLPSEALPVVLQEALTRHETNS